VAIFFSLLNILNSYIKRLLSPARHSDLKSEVVVDPGLETEGLAVLKIQQMEVRIT